MAPSRRFLESLHEPPGSEHSCREHIFGNACGTPSREIEQRLPASPDVPCRSSYPRELDKDSDGAPPRRTERHPLRDPHRHVGQSPVVVVKSEPTTQAPCPIKPGFRPPPPFLSSLRNQRDRFQCLQVRRVGLEPPCGTTEGETLLLTGEHGKSFVLLADARFFTPRD